MYRDGILEILSEGFGFLRVHGFLSSMEDVYVSQSQIKRFNLRTGDTVSGAVRPPKDSERYYSLLRIEAYQRRRSGGGQTSHQFRRSDPGVPR